MPTILQTYQAINCHTRWTNLPKTNENCEITYNKKRIDEANFVINPVERYASSNNLPISKPYWQRWIFLIYESPINVKHSTFKMNFYNLSSTYKINSDFGHFYEAQNGMRWQRNTQFNKSLNILGEKTEQIFSVISNIDDKGKRLEYIKALNWSMSVHLFGRSGSECPSQFQDGTPGDCKEILSRSYKFYLAFENSICDDYITEKFFDILKYNIIPIVRGGGKYDHYVSKALLYFLNVTTDLYSYIINAF